MRDLEPLGAELDRKHNDRFEPSEVMAVYDGVDGERQSRLAHDVGGAAFVELCPGAMGDMVADGRIDVLNAELHVFKPGMFQGRDARAVKADP